MMNVNLNEFDPQFKHLKGQKVAIKCLGEICVGILDFAGINTLLHGQYQVTLSRTPHWPVDPMTIRLYEQHLKI